MNNEEVFEQWIAHRRQQPVGWDDLTGPVLAAIRDRRSAPSLTGLIHPGRLATLGKVGFLGTSALAGALRVAVILYFVLLF